MLELTLIYFSGCDDADSSTHIYRGRAQIRQVYKMGKSFGIVLKIMGLKCHTIFYRQRPLYYFVKKHFKLLSKRPRVDVVATVYFDHENGNYFGAEVWSLKFA